MQPGAGERIVKNGGGEPSADASLFVRCGEPLRGTGIVWLQHHSRTEAGPSYRRLPLPWATLVVTLSGPSSWRRPGGAWRTFPSIALRGHATSWSEGRDEAGAKAEYLSALLEPWAVEAIAGLPAGAIRDDVVDLEQVWGGAARALFDRLATSREGERRLAILGMALAARAAGGSVADPRIRRYMRLCRATAGGLSPADAAQRLGSSGRQFRHVFRGATGCSPKRWARLERFAATLRHLHPSSWGGCDDTALPDHYDQAHAIREFREHAGVTPGAYRAAKAGGDPRVFLLPAADPG